MKRLFAFAASFVLSVSSFAQRSELEEFQFDFMFNQALNKRLQAKYQEAYQTYQNCLKLNDKSAAAWYEMSRLLLMTNDKAKALSCAEQAVKCDTSDVTLLRYALDLNLSLNRPERCIALLNQLLAIDPTDASSAVMLERLYTSKKDFDKAMHALQKADNGDISREEFLNIEKCDIYLKCKGPKEAQKFIKSLIKNNSTKSIYVSSLGTYYVQVGDTAKALKQYKAASSLPDGRQYIFDYLDLARASLTLSDYKSKIIEAFSDPSIGFEYKYSFLAKYSDEKLDLKSYPYADAVIDTLLDVAISLYPSEEDLYKMAAYNSLIRRKNVPLARSYFKKFFEFSAGTPREWNIFLTLFSDDTSENELKYINRAYYYYPDEPLISYFKVFSMVRNGGYTIEAYDIAHDLLQTIRDDKVAMDFIGVRYFDLYANLCYELKKMDDCFDAYEVILKYDEYNVLALNNYAYFLSELDQELDKAEKMSRTATSLEPNNPVYQDTYAWVLYKKGLYVDAKFVMEMCINLLNDSMPNTDRALYFDHYGDILFSAGYKDQAIDQWRKAYSLDDTMSSVLAKIEAHDNKE